ncbi:hypothetical protein JQC92_05725 [Shewanella sp. 202IG2-18]|uniref:hypothetical protein n=1 Tax=Parashewanella hymeniacidonis TaxID=2807618 RepID=UPI0019620110|nr:hypothetical protein [Parashewanella hymeniacidonis]MBM7071538.1 hypothetical protein [Parashewanella hymeniacidonis]
MALPQASSKPIYQFEMQPLKESRKEQSRNSQTVTLSGKPFFADKPDDDILEICLSFHSRHPSKALVKEKQVELQEVRRKVRVPYSVIKLAENLLLIRSTLSEHVYSTRSKMLAHDTNKAAPGEKPLTHFEYQQYLGRIETKLRTAEMACHSQLKREGKKIEINAKTLLTYTERKRDEAVKKVMKNEVKPHDRG